MFSAPPQKWKNLRLIIEGGGIVDVHQRPEETHRQILPARRRESLVEHSRCAPSNVSEQVFMRAFGSKQNVATILRRPQNNVAVVQTAIGLVEVIPGKAGTIAADQINPLAAVIEFSPHCGQEASTEIALTLGNESRAVP